MKFSNYDCKSLRKIVKIYFELEYWLKKTIIHLDLCDTDQIELMKDFLFSFLITKLYGQNESLFFLSKEVEIKIEIPCGFIDFFSKFPILQMFKNKTLMKINNLPPLIVPNKIDFNIQIVCNYLKLLKNKQLSKTDLFIKNISADALESYQTKKMQNYYHKKNVQI